MIADQIKALRKTKGATQKEVAAAIGMTERQYQDYEYGKNKPGHDALIALADFFDCSVDYLLGRTDKREINR